ncbi:maleylpyruvate isomerase family mycothiol-dependent enzyme [Micromonospora sp. NPDC050397]|uniref:maleylpyruvate isomerase family mycothiol-dependent enzyme n=1 Tax=Micromonospora sp. NPDC050397 TaxID=3364279 RepID=UPI00384F66D4
MDVSRYLECLAADRARLGAVAVTGLGEAVPGCPDWNVRELVRHLAEVYLHKVACMRDGVAPEVWPPDLTGEEPLALLDRAYAELVAEFTARDPGSPAYTWYEPDQTVAFWIRRMALETVVHRVDAEQAVGASSADIPDDLADDGVDEVLGMMLPYVTRVWADAFVGLLPDPGVRVLVDTGERSWLVGLDPSGAMTGPGSANQPVHATISGTPVDVLLWLWRRLPEEAVRRTGDRNAVDQLRRAIRVVTD